MKNARGITLTILLASLVESCSLVRREPAPTVRGTAIVMVENRDPHDISVFFVQGGQRMRLGMVVALSTASFELPERFIRAANEAQLLADPVGVPTRVASERFVLKPGQRVIWTIDAGLGRSSLGIF